MIEEEVKQALDAISKKENGSKVLDIIYVISYFAPENIHTKMFLSILNNEEELGAAIKLLKQYSIVDSDREGAVLSVDRSVQTIIRTNLQKQKKDENILKKALAVLFENRKNSSHVDHCISVWSYVSRLFETGINSDNIEHCLFVWRYRELIEASCELPNYIVQELRESVRYKEANIIGLKALDLLRRFFGESHTITLNLQHNISLLIDSEGKYKEALEVLLPLCEIGVESGRKENQETLFLIARQLCTLSRYNEALPIYQRLLDGRQVSETRDRMVLTAWHEYSHLLFELGKYRESLEILKELLKNKSETLGVENVDTLSVKSSMALIFVKQSNYCEALELFREVLYKRTAVSGENHIETLRVRNGIASVLIIQCKYDEALEIYDKVAKQYEETLGEKHPQTLIAQGNLGLAFDAKGEHQKGLEICKDVYKKLNETLGQENIETLKLKCAIGSILTRKQKYDEALMTYEEAFQGLNKILGPEHPDTAKINIVIGLLSMMSSDTIHSIARQGNLSKMKSLMQNGADINKKDVNGNTPLHYAVQYGHVSVIMLLLESGAIYNIKNDERKTPLQLAKNNTVKNLLKSVTKFFTDVKAGNHKQVAELVKEKTIVNAKEGGGSTSLHWAAYNGHSSIVKLLLESGADATQVTDKGNTPLHTASSQGYEDIVDVLLQHASRNKLNDFIDAKTTVSGATSLHIAVKNGFLDVTKSLLKRGAKYDIKNNEGKTPLDLSKDQNVNDLLKLVEELFTDAKSGNVEIISKFGAVKPDEFTAVTNARNNAGNTFLQVALAVADRHKNIVSKLLEMLRK